MPLSPDTQMVLSGALQKAKLDSCTVWGFVYWTKVNDLGEEEYGFDAFDNHSFSERDLLKMTQLATKFVRKHRRLEEMTLEPEDPSVGGVN